MKAYFENDSTLKPFKTCRHFLEIVIMGDIFNEKTYLFVLTHTTDIFEIFILWVWQATASRLRAKVVSGNRQYGQCEYSSKKLQIHDNSDNTIDVHKMAFCRSRPTMMNASSKMLTTISSNLFNTQNDDCQWTWGLFSPLQNITKLWNGRGHGVNGENISETLSFSSPKSSYFADIMNLLSFQPSVLR
jgi:hypothetical protein